MKKLIALLIILFPFSANAECWVVDGMSGIRYAQDDHYQPKKDGFSGTFEVNVEPEAAYVKYSGVDAGGMKYVPTSSNTLIGLSSNGNQQVVESWIFQSNNVVLMTKSVAGYGDFDSIKAFIGKVKSKC
ncbi:hypothetical protein KKI90_16885 [Xenorhabdus bovienii]|uniref:hypothetical protein n=1 Tax=Xenorhabdus bovienii TaxID=40576 RepID=UPI00237CF25B|nr:hypothetical protein [Xenorhabdus bovienii]MDE1487979.1 hypothetical protein [Xenorhabdus bovienii]MDE9477761.1 hypothetical protein [Xenorhabdus bovienii]MDE9530617.1 hypothetical protein [Xenorhabdus bovienii]